MAIAVTLYLYMTDPRATGEQRDPANYRGWTLKSGPPLPCGEPAEWYIVGADQWKDRRDLVIDVIWTSGGMDKFAISQRLGIDEVFWIAGGIEIHALRGNAYERVTHSPGCQGSI